MTLPLPARNPRNDRIVLYLVAIGWLYVVLMMALAEALAPSGSLLGALVTFLLYGLLPLALVLYIGAAPARRRARQARRAEPAPPASAPPDGGGHAPGDAVTAKREEA